MGTKIPAVKVGLNRSLSGFKANYVSPGVCTDAEHTKSKQSFFIQILFLV
jgi:hypothetical protein